MELPLDTLESAVLAALAQRGATRSGELQALLRRSQPTLSRALQRLAPQLLVLGAGRRTRYALPQPIMGVAAQQPLYWVDEAGGYTRWGTLSFLATEQLHLQLQDDPLAEWLTRGGLPWMLSPLRAEGFLGRGLARQLADRGLPDSPERWRVEHQLYAALQTPDAPGAVVLGEPRTVDLARVGDGGADHDRLAQAVSATLPAGSSAAGEQAKFLARREDGTPLLVKFTPPRGTPFGERWHDLLHAEALALQVLAEVGVPVAASRIVQTRQRSYLESQRFDRVGERGRRHVVPLHAVHEAFVPGPREHWAASAEALVRQKRLPPGAELQVRALMQFGRLIGNSDMHFGNLSLAVTRDDIARGRFMLAPVYDMLPMRWRPDPASGGLWSEPFTPEAIDLQSAARPLAHRFWARLEANAAVSREFRNLAAAMALRVLP